MKIGIGERYAEWRSYTTLFLLPSLQFDWWGFGFINNLDTGRIQRRLELDIHFDFLFFSSFVAIYLMWGDEGEIKQNK